MELQQQNLQLISSGAAGAADKKKVMLMSNFGGIYIKACNDTMCEYCRVRGEIFNITLELID